MKTSLDAQKQTLSKIKHLNNLPRLPQVVLNLIEACGKDETQTAEIIEIISTDPVLTARLIEMLSSAHININRDIISIETAVIYLGINTIRNLAISMAMMQNFDVPAKIPQWNMNRFWYHCLLTAIISREIASHTGDANSEEAFFAGLIHEIGALLLVSSFPVEYASILADSDTEKDIIAAEKKQFKMTRFEVGAWLCSQWNLNPLICDAVLYVNENKTRIASALPLVKIVFTANSIADANMDGAGEKLRFLFEISEEECQLLLSHAEKEVIDQAKNLGIQIPVFPDEEDISYQLAEDSLKIKVKEASLIYGTIENLLYAKTMQAVLNTIDEGIKILFCVPRLFYFLYDEKRGLLTGCTHKDDRKKSIVNSIAIPLTNRKSLLVRSLTKKSFISSLNLNEQNEIAISDVQIMRLMETDEMFCFPMLNRDKPVGVIVIGVSEDDGQVLTQSSGIIEMLAKLGAVCLNNVSHHTNQAREMKDERVSAVSDTTRRIIHEINNPLGIITSYLKILSLKLPGKHPAQKELVVVTEEIDRISSLVTQLSDFATPVIDQFEFIDINALFASILDIVEKTILLPKKIKAVFTPDTDLPHVKTCKNGLKQILINLLKNAAEAMETGGRIDIITRRIPGSEKIMIDERKKIPGKLEIIIRDNGPGIPDKIKTRLFEPYNSSKKTDHSGLGLSIIKNIINRINGTIECETTMGKGTMFKIVLPVS